MVEQTQVTLPDIGDFKDVEVIEILVAVGDQVAENDSLITLESDKASMEIPAPQAGQVRALHIKVGDRLNRGDPILTLAGADGQEVAVEEAQPPAEAPSAPPPVEAVKVDAASLIDIPLPDIGDFHDVEVIELLAQPGDAVSPDTSLITLESEKASMEVPAGYRGQLVALRVQLGDKINVGDLIATLEVAGEQGEPAEMAEPEQEVEQTMVPALDRVAGEKARKRPPVMPTPADMTAIARGRKPHAGPAVRRFARELGVDLGLVSGSGPKGRVGKEDVQGFVKQALRTGRPAAPAAGLPLPALPEVDFSRFGPVERVPLARIKKISGAHLHHCWLGVPHVTQFDEADITELEAFRNGLKGETEHQGLKLTLFPFLMKACAAALKAMPEFNSSLASDGEHLVMKQYLHLGVAVDTPKGLMVPVVRDVDRKSVYQLAAELQALSGKARDGKLLPADLQGGCFSISSLGGIGGTAFTPIVNAPEVAILGVSRASMKPQWNGVEFVPRLMLPLSLSYDHRVIDGAQGVRFTTYLAGLLGDIRRLLL